MATKTLKNKVLAAKKLFKKAKEVASQSGLGNSNVEDGRYKAQIFSAKGPVEAQASGRLQAILNFKILEGEFKDENLTSFPNLENEIGLGILIRELQNLGYEIEDFDDVEGALADLNKDKPCVRITVKTKGEFQNISIDKPLDEGDVVPEEEPAEEGLEPEPEEEPAEEDSGVINEGDTVSFTLKGADTEGEVVEVVDEDILRVKTEEGKIYKIAKDKVTKPADNEPAEEPAEEEPVEEPAEEPAEAPAEETIELEEGSEVVFTLKGKETVGEIVEVVDEETVRVKSEGKTYRLNIEKIQPAPKKKSKKAVRKLPKKKKK